MGQWPNLYLQRRMNDYTAVMIVEGVISIDNDDDYISACQHIIDTGLYMHLQGSLQRRVMSMVDAGLCSPPK